MSVRQIDAENKRERRRFVALERELFRGEPFFVAEIASDVDKPLRGRRLMLRPKRYDRAGLIAIGVLDSHPGKAHRADARRDAIPPLRELGLGGAHYYPVNDDNLASRRFAESFGGRGRILYTAYDKPLSASPTLRLTAAASARASAQGSP